MAQALINNLNTIQDTSICMKDTSAKSLSDNFADILSLKTSSDDSKKTKNDTNETGKSVSTIGDLKKTLSKEQYSAKDEIDTDNNQSNTEAIISISIENNINLIENGESSDKTNEEDETETENNEKTDTDTNITEEEPTMFKELDTLNDSTAAILLSSQQFKITDKSDNTKTEIGNNTEKSYTKGNDKTDSNTGSDIYKQFENINSKNTSLTDISPKENYNIQKDTSSAGKIIDEKIIKELNVEVLSQNTNENNGSDDILQNQTPQEQAAKALIQGDIKYDGILKEITKAADIKPVEITANKIIQQISKQMENMCNNSKLNIVLNPESLGKVNLQIINSKEGMTAVFTVMTQDARDIIAKGLNGLKENLLAQGINVDNVSVKLEETEGEYKFDYTEQEGYKGGNKHQGFKKQKNEEQDFEKIMGMQNKENENLHETAETLAV